MTAPDALVIMVKPPRPGFVKTRLVPPLSSDEAATLYSHFITDTIKGLSTLTDIKLYLALAYEEGSEPFLKFSLSNGFEDIEVIEQSGETLGERLFDIFKRLFDAGHLRVAIVGSDSPDLPPEFIKEAFTNLSTDSSKVVLGPATDGGYYLIAMSSLDERPFHGIEWSTPSVLNDTLKRLGTDAILLEQWYDIDRPEDVAKLAETGSAKESIAYILENNIFKRCKDFANGAGAGAGA